MDYRRGMWCHHASQLAAFYGKKRRRSHSFGAISDTLCLDELYSTICGEFASLFPTRKIKTREYLRALRINLVLNFNRHIMNFCIPRAMLFVFTNNRKWIAVITVGYARSTSARRFCTPKQKFAQLLSEDEAMIQKFIIKLISILMRDSLFNFPCRTTPILKSRRSG